MIVFQYLSTLKKWTSRVTQGNKMADEAAKAVTGVDRVLLVTHEVDLEDKITLRDVISMQEAASAIDKQLRPKKKTKKNKVWFLCSQLRSWVNFFSSSGRKE